MVTCETSRMDPAGGLPPHFTEGIDAHAETPRPVLAQRRAAALRAAPVRASRAGPVGAFARRPRMARERDGRRSLHDRPGPARLRRRLQLPGARGVDVPPAA